MFKTDNQHLKRTAANVTCLGTQNPANTVRRVDDEITFIKGAFNFLSHSCSSSIHWHPVRQ